MSYLSLARKYRPQNFDEIIGQEHIATTLKNAIAMDKVTHAYLFAGPRGVGKTSTARILAKGLNCEKGPTPKPCGKCTSCGEISRGISMDVIEIDGASNRGIDEIRNLKEGVKFASVHGRFRIYIIDEVHMLTQEAFNALLKTLEEPPLHVKFVFATTRPYKVLPTVISRCQRFDFRKIPIRDIVEKLEAIREEEKLEVDDGTFLLIAKQADGSMRDAEVILEQLLSFTKGKVKADDVVKVLGLLEDEILFELTNAIINNEKNKILGIINDLISSGKDPIFVTSNIIEHFRNLMTAKITKDEQSQGLYQQSQKFSLDEILYIIYTLSAAIDLIKKTSLSQIPLEIALIKLAERGRFSSIKEVLDKLSAVEEKLKSTTLEAPVVAGRPCQRQADEAIPMTDSELASPQPLVGARNDKTAESPLPKQVVAIEADILLLQKIKSSWPKILNFIKSKKMSVATFLAEGRLLRIQDGALTIAFSKENSLHKEKIEEDANKKFIEEAIKNIVGENVCLDVEEAQKGNEEILEAEMAAAEEEKIEEETLQREGSKIEPIVESAIDIFDGRIVDIREDKKK